LERSEKLKKDEKEAERISRDFTQLKVDVEAFSVQLKQTLEDAQLNMANEVIELQNAVNICEAKLKGYATTVCYTFSQQCGRYLSLHLGSRLVSPSARELVLSWAFSRSVAGWQQQVSWRLLLSLVLQYVLILFAVFNH
jgi:hypothetical protein